jgi:TrpR family trp operon transcriptional repressor
MSETEDWSLFKHLLTEAMVDKQLDDVLHFILTPEECQALPKRLVLIKCLLEGQDAQRTIAEKTGISIAKITRGSNELKRIDPAFKAWLADKMSVEK